MKRARFLLNICGVLTLLSLLAAGGAYWVVTLLAPAPAPRDGDWGDPAPHLPNKAALPAGATLRLGRSARVEVLAFSPDGKLFATAHEFDLPDGSLAGIHLWDASAGRYLRSLPGHAGNVRCAAFSPDGTVLASGGADGNLIFWDVAAGTPLGDPVKPRGGVSDVCFTPDGKGLFSAGDGVRLWDVARRQEVRKFEQPEGDPGDGRVYQVVLSPDGGTLASDGSAGVYLWDAARGKPRHRLLAEAMDCFKEVPLVQLAFPADGKTLITLGYRVRRWDLGTGKETFQTPLNPDEIGNRFLSLSADGRRLYQRRGLFKIEHVVTDLESGKELARSSAPGDAWAHFNPDGTRLLFVGKNGSLELWDPEMAERLHNLLDGVRPIVAVHYLGGGRLLSLASDGSQCQWDLAGGRELRRRRPALPDEHLPLRLSPDGSILVSVDPAGGVRLWDGTVGRELWSLPKELQVPPPRTFGRPGNKGYQTVVKPNPQKPGPDAEFVFSADGSTVAGACRDKRPPFPPATDKPREGVPEPVPYGDAQQIAVWDARSGAERWRLDTPPIHSLALSADGKTLFGNVAEDDVRNVVRVWDVATRKELGRVVVPSGKEDQTEDRRVRDVTAYVSAMAVSPDGTMLAIVKEIEKSEWEQKLVTLHYSWAVYLWEVNGKAEPRLIAPQAGPAVAFSPDGKLLALGTGHQGDIPGVYDVGRGVLAVAPGGQKKPTAVTFSPDGKALATGHMDGTILLWDVTQFKAERPADPDKP
jgi:WD40 repeat protein